MVDIKYFVFACVVFVAIMTYQYFVNKKLGDDYDDLEYLYDNVIKYLGYYRLRFGEVSQSDYDNLVGVDLKKLREDKK